MNDTNDPYCLSEIAESFLEGKSLVPFIGAGFSVDSGVPTTAELTIYLKLCIAKALGVPGGDNFPMWDPRKDAWPALKGDWKINAKKWWAEVEKKATSIDPVPAYAQAFGAITDWRLAVQYLARIQSIATFDGKNGKETREFVFSAIDPHVIDSFFLHLTANKMPSMGHKMLAFFAESLRARITLTLNFDDLLEQAFRDAGIDLQVFEVHHRASLPPWSLLGSRHCIVKMHGGKYGLRADFSLDDPPTEQERKHFRSYFIGRNWEEADENVKPSVKANLIVIGLSGNDHRVLQLVRDAIQKTKDLKVYWHCFSNSASKKLEATLSNEINNKRVVCIHHPHSGTWLWEIYQQIHKCVPPGGLEFPVTWNMPYPPQVESGVSVSQKYRDFSEQAWNCLKNEIPAVLLLESPEDFKKEWKVSEFAWELFGECRQKYRCLWLDSEDIENDSDFQIRLLQAICAALGQSHSEPFLALPYRLPDRMSEISGGNENYRRNALWEAFLGEIKDKLSLSGKEWVLFLNSRGSNAYSANMFDELDELKRPKLEQISRKVWPESVRNQIEEICQILVDENIMRIVFLCRAGEYKFARATKHPFCDCYSTGWEESRVKNAFQAVSTSDVGIKVLEAATLFPQVRHSSAFVSRVIKSNHQLHKDAWESVEDAIDTLVKAKVLRKKPGGFLWMHWQVREPLRKQVQNYQPKNERAVLHISLADWCMTFFSATKDPLAVFQAVYHRCRACQLFLAEVDEGKSSNANFVQMRGALCEAVNHLEIAQASILAWGNSLDAKRCLEGFFKFLEWFANKLKSRGPEERDVRFLSQIGARTLLFTCYFYRDLGELRALKATLNYFKLFLVAPFSFSENTENEWIAARQSFQVRLLLEISILHITCRKYSTASKSLESILHNSDMINFPQIKGNNDQEIIDPVLRWIDKEADSDRFARRRFAFSILRRLAETKLLQYELAKLLEFCGLTSDLQEDYVKEAEIIYFAARMLPRFIRETEISELGIEHCRLASIRAGILAINCDKEGVRRYINEALIASKNLPESEYSIAQSVVDLRRVYCKLMELFELKDLERFAQAQFRTIDLATRGRGRVCANSIKIGYALLEDIRLILERVESRMARSRKTFFWWMTLQRYKIIRLQYTQILIAAQSPILNCSTLKSSGGQSDLEEAANILRTTVRRVHYDAFQLARILHSFLFISRVAYGHVSNKDEWVRLLHEANKRFDLIEQANSELNALDPDSCGPTEVLAEEPVALFIKFIRDEIQKFFNQAKRFDHCANFGIDVS